MKYNVNINSITEGTKTVFKEVMRQQDIMRNEENLEEMCQDVAGVIHALAELVALGDPLTVMIDFLGDLL